MKLLDNEPQIGELTQDVHKLEDGRDVEFKLLNFSDFEPPAPIRKDDNRKRTYDEMEKVGHSSVQYSY